MKRASRIALYSIAGIAAVLIIVFAGAWLFSRSRLPVTDGEIRCAQLSAKVTVTRDRWGVPHIAAASGRDAYFAYGFTVAQDRLFQMELQRRLARGELSEMLGKSTLEYDRLFRTLMFRRTAEKELAKAGRVFPESLVFFDAFLDGVNHFIATQKLPVEFSILGVKPRPFTRVDCASILGYLAFSFSTGLKSDPLVTALRAKKMDRDILELFPGYTRERPVTIMESQAPYIGGKGGMIKTAGARNFSFKDGLLARLLSPSGDHDIIQLIMPEFHGSNSISIAPSRSASGGAIIVNDPHIGLSNPGVWYEAHIRYGDVENYGYFMPLLPFPFIAHNDTRGWGLTMLENDDMDFYHETFDPGNPSRVKFRGAWAPVETITETIKIKGGKEETIAIRVTPHGPVVSSLRKDYTGAPYAIYWTVHHAENPVIDMLYGLSAAKNMKEMERAAGLLASPGINVAYADSAGNIAWWAAGKIIVRKSHVSGKEILDGASGRDEIAGYLPFEKNPRLINPASGIIVTANNMPTVKPVGPIRQLEGYWRPSDRAARMTEILQKKKLWDTDALKTLQTDVILGAARDVLPELLPFLEKGISAASGRSADALAVLKKWDGSHSIDSAGASIFQFFAYHLMRGALLDELGEEQFTHYCDMSEHWNFFKHLVRSEGSAYWDNISTPEKKGRGDIVLKAFGDAVAELGEKFGGSAESWRWGRVHRIEYAHPLGKVKPLNLAFNIGPLPCPGEAHIINRLKSNFGKHNFMVTSAPSTRWMVDYGKNGARLSVLPSGNSGNFMSAHYSDQVKMYLAGDYRKVNFTAVEIESGKESVLTLVPGR
jgi:penicillin amidase